MLDWVLDADMQRRAQVGLNKGESHHALKNALRIGRQGEIHDRTTEGQHFRMAGLNRNQYCWTTFAPRGHWVRGQIRLRNMVS